MITKGSEFFEGTVLSGLPAESEVAATEIFGPVLSIYLVETIDDAIRFVNRTTYGNMACLLTSSGAPACKFRYEAEVGNVGINVGVAAPMAYFPFSGWKASFFGDLHDQDHYGIEFFTRWSRSSKLEILVDVTPARSRRSLDFPSVRVILQMSLPKKCVWLTTRGGKPVTKKEDDYEKSTANSFRYSCCNSAHRWWYRAGDT